MKRIAMMVGVALLAVGMVAYATPVRVVDDETAGSEWGDLDTDNVGGPDATAQATVGNPGGGLEIHADGAIGVGYDLGAGPPTDFEFEGNPTGIIDGGANADWATLIGGDGVGSLYVDFSHDAGAGEFVGLQIYFENGLSRWTANLLLYGDDPGATGWRTYGVNLDGGAQWGHTGAAGTWGVDLASVDTLGFVITYDPDAGTQLLALDNLILDDGPLPVPEPGTYVMLGSALLSMGITFRRRLNDIVAQIKEKLAA